MIVHSTERKANPSPNGNWLREDLASVEQLEGCGRLLGLLTLEPGKRIDIHTHNGELEVFYLLSGSGTYHDNGVDLPITAGDVAYCPVGATHGIHNTGDTTMTFVAFIGFPAQKD